MEARGPMGGAFRRLAWCWLILVMAAPAYAGPHRGDLVWVTGKVVDDASKPITGALVAAYDDSGKIVDYARTDQLGEYALAVPPQALHLGGKHSTGFLTAVVGKIARFVTSTAGKAVDTARAAVHAITAAQAAALPAAVSPAADMASSLEDKTFAAVTGEQRRARNSEHDPEAQRAPGDLHVKAVAKGYGDLNAVTRIFWMQRETDGQKGRATLAAWMDSIQLAADRSGKPSRVLPTGIKFASLKIEPSLVPVGGSVRITATLPAPSDPPIDIVVAARDMKSGAVWQLEPRGNGIYAADVRVEKGFPANDQVISVVAYPASGADLRRRPDVEKSIERAGLWDPAKPYVFDPLLVVSHNRATAPLSVAPGRPNR